MCLEFMVTVVSVNLLGFGFDSEDTLLLTDVHWIRLTKFELLWETQDGGVELKNLMSWREEPEWFLILRFDKPHNQGDTSSFCVV